jgi:hypothetical protein
MIWYATLRFRPVSDTMLAQAVRAFGEQVSPRILLLTSPGEYLLTLDLGSLHGTRVFAMAMQLQDNAFWQVGLVPTIALAGFASTSQVMVRAAPEETLIILAPTHEQAMLAPLPITLLAADLALQRRLQQFGLTTIGMLAQLSRSALQSQFGLAGKELYARLHHEQEPYLPMVQETPQLVCGWRFTGSCTNLLMLEQIVQRLAARLAARLQQQGVAAQALMLRYDLADGSTISQTQLLRLPSSDQAIYSAAAHALVHSQPLHTGIEQLRLIGHGLTYVQAQQAQLFPEYSAPIEQHAALVARLPPALACQLVRAQHIHPQARCLEQQSTFQPLKGTYEDTR